MKRKQDQDKGTHVLHRTEDVLFSWREQGKNMSSIRGKLKG